MIMRLSDHQLVMAAFEGALAEQEFKDLQRRLATEPDLLALYREHALLHHSLSEEFEGRHSLGETLPSVSRGPRWLMPLVAIVAVVAIGLAAWKLSRPAEASATATVVLEESGSSRDAAFTVNGQAATPGSKLGAGTRISLNQGWVRFKLAGGGLGLLQAPAELFCESAETLRLEKGRLRLEVPGKFSVKTPKCTASPNSAASFGAFANAGASDEIHVFAGEVQVSTSNDSADLRGDSAAEINGSGTITGTFAREQDFLSLHPEIQVMLEDRFEEDTMETGRKPEIGESHWRLEKGGPRISGGHLEGSGFETYFTIPGASASHPILLVTVETVAGGDKPFHSPSWAGFSLYQDGYEVCFFGDSYGPEESWTLDVKRSLVPLMPSKNVTGPRTMTLRYDRRDGTVELHEGKEPGDNPLVRSKLLPGLNFDQVRIGASPEASLAVSWLQVRAVEVPQER